MEVVQSRRWKATDVNKSLVGLLGALNVDKDTPPSEQAAAFLRQLASASKTLNTASDDLGVSISTLDGVLHKLNLGVTTWVLVSGYDNDDGPYDLAHLGYAKVGNVWGIALRTMKGHNNHEESHREEFWLFNDAPRWLRIEALPRLPDLFDGLLKEVSAATTRVQNMSEFARDFAFHVAATANELGLLPKKPAGGGR